MAKYKRTLREFIKSFPEKTEIMLENSLRDYSKDLPYIRKIAMLKQGYSNQKMCFIRKNDCLYCYNKHIGLKRAGKNIFTNEVNIGTIFIKPNSISITGDSSLLINELFKKVNINTFSDTPSGLKTYIGKSSILKAILIGKVYNQETLCKEIMSSCFHLKNVGWRTFRNYICDRNYNNPSIYDLKDFTKNVEYSIKIFSDPTKSRDEITILNDLVRNAISLGEIVDLKWSAKRALEEHRKQNELLIEKELSSKEERDIFKDSFSIPNIKLLNTEKEIFLEGKNMHHCLYNCYYKRILNKQYVAFHMTFPEDCTFSARLQDKNLVFDQIFLSYDRSVKDTTRKIAESFIEDNKEKLLSQMNINNIEILPF